MLSDQILWQSISEVTCWPWKWIYRSCQLCTKLIRFQKECVVCLFSLISNYVCKCTLLCKYWMLSVKKYIVTWLLTSSMWLINNLAAWLRNTSQIIWLWNKKQKTPNCNQFKVHGASILLAQWILKGHFSNICPKWCDAFKHEVCLFFKIIPTS